MAWWAIFPVRKTTEDPKALGAKTGWVIPRDVALVLGNGGPGWAWSIAAKPRQHCEPRFLLSHKWTGWCGAWHWNNNVSGEKDSGPLFFFPEFWWEESMTSSRLTSGWRKGYVSSEGYLVLKCPMEWTKQSLWECFSLDCISLVSQNV